MAKKYLSLERLAEYDALLKAKMAADDAAVLEAAEQKVTNLANGAVKANTDAIADIRDDANIDSFADVVAALAGKQDTGDYATKAEAQGYANAKDDAIKAAQDAADAAQKTADGNAEAIEAINDEETGILAQAKAYTDDEAGKVQESVDTLSDKVGAVPEGSTVMGIITNIQENAYDDTALVGRIDAVEGKVTTLIGDDADKSVRTIANEELAKQLIADGAKEALDSLEEIAAWIQSHPDDASAMNLAIEALQNKVVLGTYVDGEETKEYATVKAYVEAVTGAETLRVDGLLAGKVDKVDGKGLSTNDLTNELKGHYDDAYEHSQVAHAPANAQANVIESVKVNGTALTVTGKAVDITVPVDNSELTNGAGYLVAADIANKADKATTLEGYGITDAYTAAQIDTFIEGVESSSSSKDAVVLAEAQKALQAEIERAMAAEKANADAIALFEECTKADIEDLFA